MTRHFLLLLTLILFVSGCASSKNVAHYTDKKITAPKVIALQAPRAPWMAPITHELRKRGFKVLRWASQKQTITVDANKTSLFHEASTRYLLIIDGQAYLDSMHRCYGGGYKFIYINADLVDVNTNETIANFSDAGYSENCPPLSGTIFKDLAETVDSSWQ